MTIPALSNCEHQGSGWCLGCINKLWHERDTLLRQRNVILALLNQTLPEEVDVWFERYNEITAELRVEPIIGIGGCYKCNGKGKVIPDAWVDFDDFRAAHKDALAERTSEPFENFKREFLEDAAKWWAERGYSMDQLPPDLINCNDCGGKGYV